MANNVSAYSHHAIRYNKETRTSYQVLILGVRAGRKEGRVELPTKGATEADLLCALRQLIAHLEALPDAPAI